ncbi:MAG: ROK family protein [Sulfurimonas sp.]|uniref:ROK family protein n=1 Tax=Sulfurimonas sp. TaxID=2022749 RepID=UPI0025E5F6F2|nr:ROK family protein [Sulfurimonas sp.]MCK9490958.1 ROK family protein [Sulfurimonas sp.]
MTLVVDAGGTHLRAEIHSKNGLQEKLNEKSSTVGLASWMETIIKDHSDIKTICISYAGQVKDGVIISAPNIKVDVHEIKEYFKDKYEISLFIENDLNCAVIAESTYLKEEDVCAIYIGTGLGLGVVSSGNLITGFSGVATEIGHIAYKEAPFVCGCGKSNCIELFASGSALDRWKKHKKIDPKLNLQDLKDTPEFSEIYKEFELALLYSVSTAITLFNPKVVVLGGGIIESNPQLESIIASKIEEFAMPVALRGVKIIKTKLNNAPIIGALMLKDLR